MADLARWNLKVSRETDISLRTLIASRGGRKGDMSRFVEQAVAREVFRETVKELHAQNAGVDHDALMGVIDEELAEVRRLRRADA